MACKSCDYRGFIEYQKIIGGSELPGLSQCVCRDTLRYSDQVRRMMNLPPIERGPAKVIPFRPKSGCDQVGSQVWDGFAWVPNVSNAVIRLSEAIKPIGA